MGLGIVRDQVGDMLTIDFLDKTCKFQCNEITFSKFLTAEDPEIQGRILRELNDQKMAAQQKKQEEAMTKQCLTAAQRENKGSGCVPKKAHTKPLMRQERIPGKPMTFYVFQGSTFDRESRGGYIWAPISNKTGNTFHHWDRLLDIRPGDIIFHGYNGHVQAISVARGKCYECNQPEELRTENLWDQEGRRVDCEYLILRNPIKTSHYTNDILRLCNVKYAPFDKDGNGNMGYLYELNRELAQIFMRGIIKGNPAISRIDYVLDLLYE